jgi:hypothetical protein
MVAWARKNENISMRNSNMGKNAKRDSDQKVSGAKGATYYFTLPL